MKKLTAFLLLLTVIMSLMACNSQETTEILCLKCNESISSNAKFCPSCGASIGDVDNNNSDDNEEENKQDEQTNNNEENKINNNNSSGQSNKEETYKCAECGSKCDKGHSYCRLHECSKSSCLMQQKAHSSYCVAHSCLLCGKERYGSSAHCYSHKCYSCGNAKVDGSNYCVSHKCLLCDKKAFGSKDYCSDHD